MFFQAVRKCCILLFSCNVLLLSLVASSQELDETTSPIAINRDITVADIIDGIRDRQSRISSLLLDYTGTYTNEPGFYQFFTIPQDENETVPPGPRYPIVRPGFSKNRKETQRYDLAFKEDKIGYAIWDIASTDQPTLKERGAFDGENVRRLNIAHRDGVVQSVSPENIILFPTISDSFLIEDNQTLEQYLVSPDVNIEVREVIERDGDILIRIVGQLYPDLGPEATVKVIREHEILVNMSKDFWPVEIKNNIYMNAIGDQGKAVPELKSEVRVLQLESYSGVYHPVEVVVDYYESNVVSRNQHGLATKFDRILVSRKHFKVNEIALNEPIPDDFFTINFEDGDSVYDDNKKFGYIAGLDPDELGTQVRNLVDMDISNRDSTPALSEISSAEDKVPPSEQIPLQSDNNSGSIWIGVCLAVIAATALIIFFKLYLFKDKGNS